MDYFSDFVGQSVYTEVEERDIRCCFVNVDTSRLFTRSH